MESDISVHRQNLLRGKTEGGPRFVVEIIGVRDDGVEAIVAAGHLQDDEDGVVLAGNNLGGGIGGLSLSGVGGKSVGQKRRDSP